MSAPLSPEVALLRLAQYGERTSTWSTATYNDGSEKALHEIALTLADRVAELEAERHSTNEALDDVVAAIAEKNARITELEAAAPRVITVPPASFVLKAMANVPDSLPRCPVCTFAPAYCTCFGKTHRFDPERLGVSDAKRRLANCVGCGQPRTATCHVEAGEPA